MKPIAWVGLGSGALVAVLSIAGLILRDDNGDEVARLASADATAHLVQSPVQNQRAVNDESDEPTLPVTVESSTPTSVNKPTREATPPIRQRTAAPLTPSATSSSRLSAFEQALREAGICGPGIEASPKLLVAYLTELRGDMGYTGREVASLRVQNRMMRERVEAIRHDVEAALSAAGDSASGSRLASADDQVAAYARAIVDMAAGTSGVEPSPEMLAQYLATSQRGVSNTGREVARLRAQNRTLSERIDALNEELRVARKAAGRKP